MFTGIVIGRVTRDLEIQYGAEKEIIKRPYEKSAQSAKYAVGGYSRNSNSGSQRTAGALSQEAREFLLSGRSALSMLRRMWPAPETRLCYSQTQSVAGSSSTAPYPIS